MTSTEWKKLISQEFGLSEASAKYVFEFFINAVRRAEQIEKHYPKRQDMTWIYDRIWEIGYASFQSSIASMARYQLEQEYKTKEKTQEEKIKVLKDDLAKEVVK